MPNGQQQEQVQVTMPGGKVWTIPKANLSAAQQRGAKLVTTSPKTTNEGTGTKVARGALLGTFSGMGIPETEHPIKDMLKGILPSVKPEDIAARMADPLQGGTQAIIDMFRGGVQKPATDIYKGVQQKDPEMIAHGGAQAVTETVLALLGRKAPEVAAGESEVATGLKGAAREVVGIGDKDIAKTLTDSAKKVEEAQAKATEAEQEHSKKVDDAKAAYAKKVEATKEGYAKKVGETEAKKVEASKAQSAAETRKAALQTKRGPVYQRMTEMADTAQKNVKEVDTKVRAVEGAKWNAFRRGIGNPEVDWTPWQKAVVDAEQNILQGVPENIAIFKQIMKETGEDVLADASVFRGGGTLPGSNLKEVMRSKNPAEQAQFLENLRRQGIETPAEQTGAPTEGLTVPMDKARAFYTKLGEKMHGRELPGRVYHALKTVQEAGDAQITKTIAEHGGKDAVIRYRELKSDWRDYMQAFHDWDSPLRKLKEGADPNDKLRPIVGDEAERAIKLFGKYKQYGADVQAMGKAKSLFTSIKELASSGAKPPAEVAKPKFPEKPKMEEAPKTETPKKMNAYEARKAKIQQAAQSYAHPPSRWELMFPPLLAYRMGLKKLLQSPAVQDWLAKGGEGPPPSP